MKELSFTKHVLRRYAERMQDYDTTYDVELFVSQHEDMIKDNISKLVEYSDLIFTGKSSTEYDRENVDVYLNRDGWVIIVTTRNQKVITLYRITLGLDAEFDREYLTRVRDKIVQIGEKRDEKLQALEQSKSTYQAIINDNQVQISELKAQLKHLADTVEVYQEVIKNLEVDKEMVDKELKDFIATLLHRKVF